MSRTTRGSGAIRASVAVAWTATVLGACAAAGDTPSSGRGSGSSSTGSHTVPGGTGTAGSGFDNTAPGTTPPEMHVPVNTVIMMGDECAATGATAKNEIRPVDIIWAIDSSPSMSFVIHAMAMQMNTLVTTVTAAGIDVHIVLISALWTENVLLNNVANVGDPVVCIMPPIGSGDCANDSKTPGYHHVTDGCGGATGEWACAVSSHNALSRLIDAYPVYMTDLRPNSIKYFGAVTDDTANNTLDYKSAADKFTMEVTGLNVGDPGADWKFFAIINPSSGQAYQMLADQTGGITGMVGTNEDYSALFNMLAQTVTETSQLTCEWAIPPIPDGAGQFNKFKVNVTYSPGDGSAPMQFGKLEESQCAGAPMGGWYYDSEDAPTKVLVCPQTCGVLKNDLMGKVDVLFGCDTVKAPT